MDFLENLFDLGDRRHNRGRHGGRNDHDDHHSDDRYHDHDDRYDDRGSMPYRHEAGGPAGSCVKCSAPLAAAFKFCPGCGTQVSRQSKCAACGSDLVENAKFCAACGAKTGPG
jgi:hypothetical protein